MLRRKHNPQGDWHMIDAGRVGCPIRGDLGIDHCFGCAHLIDVAKDDDNSYIVCRPMRTALDYYLPMHAGF